MKNTKKSLFFSITAMILCCALLAGTTFAWFTDSASTGVNTIVAGNLDIAVYHRSASVETNETIENETALFRDASGNAMNWEPGAVSYETFTVKNEGTLALKYKLAINILDYNALGDKTLKDVLKVKVLTGNEMLSTVDRASVMAQDWNTADTLDVFNTSGQLYPSGSTAGASEQEFQVIVYWQPGGSDNNWNVNNGKATTDGQPLFINFGINVVASQLASESDSFDNKYDQGIALPDLPVSVNKVFQSAPITGETVSESVQVKNVSTNVGVATVQADSVNAVIAALKGQATDKAENSDLTTVIYLDVQTGDKTETSVTYNINLSATLTYTDTNGVSQITTLESLNGNLADQIVTATMEIGKGLSNVTVKHHEEAMTQLASAEENAEGYYYNRNTGVLTIKSKSFSPFTVDYTIEGVAVVGDTTYSTLEDAVKAAKDSDAVVLLKDVALTSDLQLGGDGKSLTLHLNKHTIDGGEYQVYTAGVGTITICGGGTIKNTSTNQNADYAPLRIYQYSSVVLDGVTVNGGYCAVKNSGNLTVKKANITGTTFGLGCFLDGTTVIGQLDGNNSDIIVTAKEQALATAAATGYAAMNVTVNSGTFTSSGTVWDDCPAYWAGHGTLNVYGGIFKNETSGTGAAGLLQKNGTVNVFGGTFTAKDGIKLVAQSDSTEIVTAIQGGTFTGTRSGIYVDAGNSTYMGQLTQYGVSIANGNGNTVPAFTGRSEGAIYAKIGGLGDRTLMTISGGSFDENPSAYVVDGKMAVQGADGRWTIGDPPASWAFVTDETEFNNALKDTTKDKIIVKNDIVFTSQKTIQRTVTVDLGTNKLTTAEKDGSYSASVFLVEYNGNLSLLGKAGSLIKSGDVTNAQYSEGNPTIRVYSPGSLAIDGVNVEGHNMTGKEVTSSCTAGEAIEVIQKNGNTSRGSLVINNATVKSGELPENEQNSGFGNALSLGGSVDVTLTNCTFSAGYTHKNTYPATVKLGGRNMDVYMENCTVTAPDLYFPQYGNDHRAAAGIYNAGSKMTLIDCRVYGKNNKSFTQGAISINGTCDMYFKDTIVQADGTGASTYDISITSASARPIFHVAGTDNISGLRFYNRNYVTIAAWVE